MLKVCFSTLNFISELIHLFLRKLCHRFGGPKALQFYQQPVQQNFHFCYINNKKLYLINCVDQLLFHGKPVTMFVNKEQFVIHKESEPCSLQAHPSMGVGHHHRDMSHPLVLFVKEIYPKQRFLPIVCSILIQHELITDSFYFIYTPTVHITDFCSFISNRFANSDKVDPNILKLCKYLKQQHIKIPKIAIKNPFAQSFLC